MWKIRGDIFTPPFLRLRPKKILVILLESGKTFSSSSPFLKGLDSMGLSFMQESHFYSHFLSPKSHLLFKTQLHITPQPPLWQLQKFASLLSVSSILALRISITLNLSCTLKKKKNAGYTWKCLIVSLVPSPNLYSATRKGKWGLQLWSSDNIQMQYQNRLIPKSWHCY